MAISKIFKIGVASIFILLSILLLHNVFLDHQDKQQFLDLKTKFLTLQESFSKADIGWDYEEGCESEPMSKTWCTITLVNESEYTNSKTPLPDTYMQLIASEFHLAKSGIQIRKDFSQPASPGIQGNFSFTLKKPPVECRFGRTAGGAPGLWCTGIARGLYFERGNMVMSRFPR